MEANRETAMECLKRAQLAMNQGDFAKAERFLSKSEKLFPTPKLQQVRAELTKERRASAQRKAGSGGNSSSSSSSKGTASSGGRQGQQQSRQRQHGTGGSSASASASASPSGGSKKPYTVAQQRRVAQVLRADSLYAVLGVSQGASESEIKKGYRKAAFDLHPDKNSAPHADEAFKRVSKAFTVLSDASSRRTYDVSGDADAASAQGSGGGGGGGHGGFRNMTPEEQFAHFFADLSGMQFHPRMRRRPQRRQEGGGFGNGFEGPAGFRGQDPGARQRSPFALLQMLFIVFTVFIMPNLFSSGGNRSKEAFSLRYDAAYYPVQRTHSEFDKMIYYVSKDTDIQLKSVASGGARLLPHLERQVERAWVGQKRRHCHTEERRKHQSVQRGGPATKTDSCDLLRDYGAFLEAH